MTTHPIIFWQVYRFCNLRIGQVHLWFDGDGVEHLCVKLNSHVRSVCVVSRLTGLRIWVVRGVSETNEMVKTETVETER